MNHLQHLVAAPSSGRLSIARIASAGLSSVLLVLSPAFAGSADALMRPADHATHAHRAGSGVDVKARIERPSAREIRVLLTFDGVRDADGATVAYSLIGPGRILEQDATVLPPGGSVQRTLRVRIDDAAGDIALNVFTRQSGVPSALAIPLAQGTGAQRKAAPRIERDAGGQPLAILPASRRP